MPASYVRAYVKRGKNDAADAAASFMTGSPKTEMDGGTRGDRSTR
jgi:hypothetical protein